MLGALAPDASLLQKLGYQLNGLVVVFVALGGIWLLMEIIGIGFKRVDAAKAAEAARAHPKPAATPQAEDHVEPATVVAIAAAVHDALGRSARIVSIKPEQAGDWAREGRRQIFSSHQVR